MPPDALLIATISCATLLVSFGLVVAHYRNANRELAAQLRRQTEIGSGVIEGDARYRLLFEHAPMGCMLWEPGFKVIEWNRQAEQIFGWTREEMVGRSILGTLIQMQGRQQLMQDATTLFATGTMHYDSVPHVTSDGRTIFCEWHHSVMRDEDGAPSRIISLCVDVTCIKKLTRDNTLFRSIVEFTDDPSVLLLDHKASGRVVYANNAACRHFGISRDELLGTTPVDWDVHVCPDSLAEFWRTVLENKVYTFETDHRHASGTTIPVEVTLNLVEHEGRSFTVAYTRNIAARKANEARLRKLEVQAALREHDERYKEVFENSAEALFVVEVASDQHLAFGTLNPAAERAFAVPAATLTGAGFAEIFSGELGPRGRSLADNLLHYQRCAAEGVPVEYEGSLDLQNGGQRQFHVRLIPFADSQGVARIIGIGSDITARRQLEAELQRRTKLQEQLAAVAAAVPGFIFTIRVDRNGHASFPFASSGVEALFGLRPEDIRLDADVLRARYHPDELPRMRKLMQETARTLAPFRIEIRINHPEFGQRWVEVRSTPQRQPDGAIEWHGLMIDITERKLAEDELRHMHEFTAALVNAIPDPVFVKDRQHRWIMLNDEFCRFIGYPREALIGKSDYDFFPAAEANVFWEKDERVFITGQANINEELLTDASRIMHHVQTKKSLVTTSYQPDVLVGIIRDLTELKETERRLLESRALLQELSAHRENAREEERKRISRDLHEEIGQLLTALRMSIATLPLQYGEILPTLADKADGMLALTDHAIKGMRGIVAALRPTTLDAGLAAGLEWLASDFSTRSGIECRLRVSEALADIADSQATAVFRIAQEALANVARHAQASRVDVRLVRDHDQWHLTVRDNGCGFDADARRERSLGIFGMRERALMLGGDFSIFSLPQQGTVVELRFPIQQLQPYCKEQPSLSNNVQEEP